MTARHNPLVTVVIPFYNDPYIADAVDSALRQTYEPVETIIVNDGSVRETERLVPYLERIHVLGKANGGTASALNHGFRHASGEYVAWLSSDDRFLPDKIGRQLRFMQETGCWISHTGFRYIDDKGMPCGEPIQLSMPTMAAFYRTFLDGNPVNGCTVMMRKELFARLGGFDESQKYTHDYDFWLRAILAGFPLGYCADPLTEYRRHGAMGTIVHHSETEREFRKLRAAYRPRIEKLLEAITPVRGRTNT